jgi:eukaryotic-like serine/threonine-protein kinase
MTLAPGTTLLHYSLVERIGEGGMGVVWKATDATLGRDVAIKVLPATLAADPERLQRFEREAKVLASLNHQNVATVHGFHEAEGVWFLVMELVDGETLEQRLARGPIPIDDALAIARRIVEAVEYAHERGIVHRDLKPANIQLTADGGLKVLDFGLAKAVAGDPTTSGPTSTPTVMPTLTSMGTVAGMILGTAAYMSPEQARGGNVDRRADIWAFGAILFEMLTGRRAFEGDTVSDTLASVLRAPIEFDQLPPATPAAVTRLLRRCLERDPRKRLRDIGEARIALEAIGSEPEVVAAPVPAVVPPPKRAALPWAVAALAVLAAAVLAGVIATRKAPEERVARFDVPLDAKLGSMTWPRLSPDGRLLAFQGRDASGKIAIWIRPLDAASPYPLAGTEGAAGRPFWSPDGRYLAYFDGRQLKKVPVAGGPPQLIGEAENGADGSWGSTGVIVFDGRGAIDPIRRIPAAGGQVTPALVPDPKAPMVGGAWPFFLPDGKHFLFTSGNAAASGGKMKICVAALDVAGHKELTESGSRVEYANGFLVYVLRGTLVAQRFDPDELALAGDPVPLADHVSENGTRGLFSLSGQGELSYQTGAGQIADLVWVGRDGRQLGTVGPPADYIDVALSPDGTQLAYALYDARGDSRDIWVRDLSRDTSSRLTFDSHDEIRPVWSPDGSRIFYGSNRTGSYAVMSKAANGTGDEQAVYADESAQVTPSDRSRDGKWMTMERFGAGTPTGVVVVPTSGAGKPTPLPASSAQISGRFTPDGRYLAYVSNETGSPEIYVQTWPLGGGKWQISSGGGVQPRFRADGKELFYRGTDDTFRSVTIQTSPRFEAGVPVALFKRRLATGAPANSAWQVSSDGQKFLLVAAQDSAAAPPFTIVLNWPETLKSK